MKQVLIDCLLLFFLSLVVLFNIIPFWVFFVVIVLVSMRYVKLRYVVVGLILALVFVGIILFGKNTQVYYLVSEDGGGGVEEPIEKPEEDIDYFAINKFIVLFGFVLLPIALTLGLRLAGAGFRTAVGNSLAVTLIFFTAMYVSLTVAGYTPYVPEDVLRSAMIIVAFIPSRFIDALVFVTKYNSVASIIVFMYFGVLIAVISSIITYYATSIISRK